MKALKPILVTVAICLVTVAVARRIPGLNRIVFGS